MTMLGREKSYVMGANPRKSRHSASRRIPSLLLAFGLFCLVAPTGSHAASMDYNGFTCTGFQGFISWIDGRMGFEQENGGTGTLNNFRSDLGLPINNQSYRIVGSVRPLEHHLLRIFGTVPEHYKGSAILNRDIVTKNTTYPAGAEIDSDLKTAMFGFGYDLDFFIGPRWFGGIQGDLRYIDLRVALGHINSDLRDQISLSELVPCIGAHFESRFPFGFDRILMGLNLGPFARMTYGINPTFFNYVDVVTGVSILKSPTGGPIILNAKVGYELESYFHNQENIAGRTLELRREGVFFSVEGAF
jgi:hypothetical protein